LFGALGPEVGGVYVTVEEVASDSVPQVGEQAVPLAVRFQLTPLFEESFCTAARKTTATVPAWRVVTLLVIETEILFPPFPLPAPAPQAVSNTVTAKSEYQPALTGAVAAGPKRRLVPITLLQVRELKRGSPEEMTHAGHTGGFN
jgi:hypothetical protein